jgi:hypothetical protein
MSMRRSIENPLDWPLLANLALRVRSGRLNVYAVVGDNGRLVTAAHRTKRFNRI